MQGRSREKSYLYTLMGSFLLFFITYIRLGSFLELRQILKCSTFRMNYLNNEIKKSEVSDDEQKNCEIDVQKHTDAYIKKTDEVYVRKEKEILTV